MKYALALIQVFVAAKDATTTTDMWASRTEAIINVTNATAKATTTEWFGAAGASSTTKVASKTTTTTSTTASKATSTTTTGSAAEVAPMTTDLACPVGVNGTQWFGPECRFRCNCATGSSCARSNGECGECREGYSGLACDQAICTDHCGPFGRCVAPEQCVCYQLYSIEKETIVHEESGTEKIVHRCVSLRISGLKGAFISLGVLIVSILFCGCVQSTLNKRNRAYSYVD